MKIIAIHNSKLGFHPRWVEYCKRNDIPHKIVNAYDNDIIEQLQDCAAFMWHHAQFNYKDMLFAKQLLFSLEQAGIKVFPDFNTAWHFDDKVGQKYLLEATEAPLVPSYVFYTKKEALAWAKKTDFPKVFKLRGGAGSANVKLAKNYQVAVKLINQSFGRGFKQYRAWENLQERFRKYREGKTNFRDVVKGLIRFIYPTDFAKMYPPEKGYVYFQDFIPNNDSDLRIVVIGNKAFALKRLVRKNDFRASGGGEIIYHKAEIDQRCVEIAFTVNKKVKSQSIAYDFVFDASNNPLIVEISYGYSVAAYDLCEGFWTSDMVWHEGTHFDFCGWMVEDLIKK
jgi:glutathione synthase/RimK-type ligase-like ATP-grasp enzyme